MKAIISTAAVAIAAVGLSNIPPATAHLDQTAERATGGRLASTPFGLSFEDLRVGLTGKASAEVGSTELPVRVAQNAGCRTNSNCN
jgi:hypothetical protein